VLMNDSVLEHVSNSIITIIVKIDIPQTIIVVFFLYECENGPPKLREGGGWELS
jgi:hypothetical protein